MHLGTLQPHSMEILVQFVFHGGNMAISPAAAEGGKILPLARVFSPCAFCVLVPVQSIKQFVLHQEPVWEFNDPCKRTLEHNSGSVCPPRKGAICCGLRCSSQDSFRPSVKDATLETVTDTPPIATNR